MQRIVRSTENVTNLGFLQTSSRPQEEEYLKKYKINEVFERLLNI